LGKHRFETKKKSRLKLGLRDLDPECEDRLAKKREKKMKGLRGINGRKEETGGEGKNKKNDGCQIEPRNVGRKNVEQHGWESHKNEEP